MKLLFCLISTILMLSGCSVTKNSFRQKDLAIINVTVVDVINGSLLLNQSLLIREKKIISAGPSQEIEIPKNAKIVDANGKFIIPGLWDMHVHLQVAGKESLPHFIANGVTGVRDMGANSFSLLRNWKDQIEQGYLIGPHLILAGPMLDGPFVTTQFRVTVNTSAEARAAVDSLAALGVDFIKVHQQISREAYLSVAAQAKKHNLPLAGHLPTSITAREAVDGGQKSIEHIFTVPDSTSGIYSYMKENGTSVTPTLVVMQNIARYHDPTLKNDSRSKYLSPLLKAFWKDQIIAWGESVDKTVDLMKTLLPEMLIQTKLLHHEGVRILAGTDLAVINVYPGSSLHEELALLVKAGLRPWEALQTATINPARFFKNENFMGSVEAGKMADLVLLNSNPLEDISNTKDIYMVIFNGQLYDQLKLNMLLR